MGKEVLCLGVKRGLQGAVASFAAMLDTHKWVAMASAAARARPAPVPTIAGGEGRGSEPPPPPYELMEFAPLAVLTNGLLGALNELRHCAPLALATPAARLLQVRLLSVDVGVKRRESRAHLSCKALFCLPTIQDKAHAPVSCWRCAPCAGCTLSLVHMYT